MSKAMRQMLQRCGRASVASGEAERDLASDEASDPPREHPGTGSELPKTGPGGLLQAALTRENLSQAWRRVKANKGAAGVDGLSMEETAWMLAANSRNWWRNSAKLLNSVLTIAWFDQMGLLRLS